jgi:hypothetical protein
MTDVIERLRVLAAETPEPDEQTMLTSRASLEALIAREPAPETAKLPSPRAAKHRTRIWSGRRRLVAFGCLALSASIVLLVSNTGSKPQTAQAAVIRGVRAAITPPLGVILHAKVENAGAGGGSGEFWQLTRPPYSSRGIKQSAGVTVEYADSGTVSSTYDPATNTITERPDASPAQFTNLFALIGQALASGQARLIATTTISGQQVYEILLADGGKGFFRIGSYRPVLLELPSRTGQVITYSVSVFEYLPATAANLSLLSLSGQHPGAHVVQSAATTGKGN